MEVSDMNHKHLDVCEMDGIMQLLTTNENKLKVGIKVENYISNPNMPFKSQYIGIIVRTILPWLCHANSKVGQSGYEILNHLAYRMGEKFICSEQLIDKVISCLGINKYIIRSKAQLFLLYIMEKGHMSPQNLLNRLHPGFNHKNPILREEILLLLTKILKKYGANKIGLSEVISSIVKLLSDRSEKVREAATNTLSDIYNSTDQQIRERIHIDLRRYKTPRLIIKKFEQMITVSDKDGAESVAKDLRRKSIWYTYIVKKNITIPTEIIGKRQEIMKVDVNNLQVKQIKQLMQQEKDIADIKLNSEKTMAAMKKEHLHSIYNTEIENLVALYQMDLEIKKLKMKILQKQLIQEEEEKKPDLI